MEESGPSDSERTKIDEVVSSARKQASEGAPGAIDGPAAEPEILVRRHGLPQWIGAYQVQGLIAHGGGAWVFDASQLQPLRRVAVKVLRNVLSPEAVRRFVHEGRLLARLEHPNIVRVYEVGRWRDDDIDRPYLAMEYIGPQDLVRYAREQKLDARQRLRLLIQVCQGVQHAHARGIIHRDLKPGNVVVDAEGCPKVLDFGVAKAVSDNTTMHTATGQWLGTPPYMSPEQFTHDPDDIDVRCDVYALGAIGYELLSGEAPFRHEGRSTAQIIRQVCEHDPPRLGLVNTEFAGDVETIFTKVLQKRPEDRYDSVAALEADLQAYLDHRPITARRIGWGGVALRWAHRQPAAAASTAAAVILAVLLLALLVNEYTATRRLAEQQRQELYVNKLHASVRAFHREDMETASRRMENRGASAETRDLRGFAWHHLWKRLHSEERELRVHEDSVYDLAFSPDGSRMVSCGKGEWCLWDTHSWDVIHRRARPGHTFSTAAFLPDGASFITASHFRGRPAPIDYLSHRLRRWDSRQGELIVTSPPLRQPVNEIAISSDGRQVICGGGTLDERVRHPYVGQLSVLAADTLRPIPVPYERHPQSGHVVENVREFPTVAGLAITPDQQQIALAQVNKPVRLMDTQSGASQPIAAELASHAASVDVSPDGRWLAIGNWDDEVVLWDLKQQQIGGTLPHARAHLVRFSPDGKLLATTGIKNDTSIVLWRVEDQTMVDRLQGHSKNVWSLGFTPSGSHLLSGAADRTIRVWNLEEQHKPPALVHGSGEIDCLDLSSNGRWVAWGARNGDAVLCDLETSEPRFRHHLDRVQVRGVGFHPNQSQVAFGFRELPPGREEAARIGIFQVPSGALIRNLPDVRGQCLDVGFSPDGNWIATTYMRHENPALLDRLQVWNTSTWNSWTFASRDLDAFNALAFSPDSAQIACVGDDRRLRIWETATGDLQRESQPFPAPLVSVAYSPQGDRLAIGNWPRDEFGEHPTEIRVLDAESLQTEQTLLGHRSGAYGLAFSPDASTLASGAGGGLVKLWDMRTGSELATLPTPGEGWVFAVKFSPDGRSLLATYGSEDEDCGVIRFDAATEDEVRTHRRRSRGHQGPRT